MAVSISAFDHKQWDMYNLEDFGEFSDKVEYCNQEEYGDGNLEGDWWYSPEAPVESEEGKFLVIYHGTFGNYNSPGASSYTRADLYDTADPEEVAAYKKALAEWETCEEFLECEDEDEWEDDEDDITEYCDQCGENVDDCECLDEEEDDEEERWEECEDKDCDCHDQP